jgi:hypothetical protein
MVSTAFLSGIALRQNVQTTADFCFLQTLLPAIDT